MKQLVMLPAAIAALVSLVGAVLYPGTQQMTGKLENAAVATVSDTETVSEPEVEQITYGESEAVVIISKAVYGEAGICSTTEQAAVVWCICNRVDAGYGDLVGVTTAPGQFYGYNEDNPVDPDIEALVQDVLIRWQMEGSCVGSVGRVLPKDYLWFSGDGLHNHYRNDFESNAQWDWSLPSPYEEGQ